MASSATYRVERTAEGWLARADGDERVFADKDEALRWCERQAVQGGTAAAPEEGTYEEADIEIDDG